MRRSPRRHRGGTLAEVLIYSFLTCLLGGAVARLMIDYRILSLVFDARATITTSANQTFGILRSRLLETTSKGVTIATDGRTLAIQAITGANSLGQTTWSDSLHVLFYDPTEQTLYSGNVPLSSLGLAEQGEGAKALTDDNLTQLIAYLRTEKQAYPMIGNLVELKYLRTSSNHLKVEAVLEKSTYRDGKVRVERDHHFPLLTSEDL